MNSTVAILAVGAVVGSGLVGGLLFAFSNFIMRALRALPSESAATAMREVNVRILNAHFVVLFVVDALEPPARGARGRMARMTGNDKRGNERTT